MSRRRNEPQDDWLTLVEIEEPFLAEPVLRDRIGTHPIKTDTAKRNRILEHCAALVDRRGHVLSDTDPTEFTRWLLEDQLGHKVSGAKATLHTSPTQSVTFTTQGRQVNQSPTMIVHDPGGPDSPRMLVCTDLGGTLPGRADAYEPERRHKSDGWVASPVHRATSLARRLGCRLALITNGRLITLVGIHDHVVGHGTWDTTLFRPEPRHLDSLLTVLDPNRLFGAQPGRLEAMLDESLDKQQDVTKSLGRNVRRAAELLVAELSRANRRTEGRLFAEVPEAKVYEAAVTVIMRTVFLLTAEENGLLPVDNELYRQHYAASTLYARLEGDLRAGSATAQRRSYAWHRLLGLFRAVHDGVNSDALTVNAYGGSLFDPERFPFLEGRTADGDEVDTDLVSDLVMHDILGAITVVDGKTVSFRALDVEQIGHVYESLLDHSTAVADGPVLGVVGKEGLEPEIQLADLEDELAKGPTKFASWFEKATNKATKAKWVRGRLELDLAPSVARGLLPACGGDQALYDRVRPFANLIRTDLRGLPMVILDGDLYVTETTDKSDTGTAYTTKELADEIAEHALAPLVFSPGPRDTADKDRWELRSPAEILDLKVCDPAIGSAAIAVAAVRYLARRLVEARQREGLITDDQLTSGAADSTQLDVHIQARRDVVAHCIYGVDMDPMAIEMAKMSLWLVTMARDRPFTFLDHAIKCGDSLLGITELRQLEKVHLEPSAGGQDVAMLGAAWVKIPEDYETIVRDTWERASALRGQLRSTDVRDQKDAAAKADLHRQVEELTGGLRAVADATVAACLSTAQESEVRRDDRLNRVRAAIGALGDDDKSELARLANRWTEEYNPHPSRPRRLFHWPLEFPEVFNASRKFDAMVGNPPFLGGSKIALAVGEDYRNHITRYLADGFAGKADLVAYFFRRAAALSLTTGFIATTTVYQGDTCQVGLHALQESYPPFRVSSYDPWPGAAQVAIAKWWASAEKWNGPRFIDGHEAAWIASDFYPSVSQIRVLPRPLSNEVAGIGKKPGSEAFVVPGSIARLWGRSVAGNVVRPYVGGRDLGARDVLGADRYLIDFGSMTLAQAQEFEALEYVASRLPAKKLNAKKWWQLAAPATKVFDAIRELELVVVVPESSSFVTPQLMANTVLWSNSVSIIATDDPGIAGLVCSTIHRVWVDRYCSTLKADPRYTPSDAYRPFPKPPSLSQVSPMYRTLGAARSEGQEALQCGITGLYSRFHDESDASQPVMALRKAHVELDAAIMSAYQWTDRDLAHGFHETRFGRFFSMSTEARFDVLERLLLLNHRQSGG